MGLNCHTYVIFNEIVQWRGTSEQYCAKYIRARHHFWPFPNAAIYRPQFFLKWPYVVDSPVILLYVKKLNLTSHCPVTERERDRDRDRERQRHGQTDRRREINLTCRHFWVQTAFQRFQWLFSSVKRRAVPCAPHTWGRCFALQHYVYCYHVRTQTQALPDRVILSVIHRAERSIRACSWQTCSDFRIPDILVLRV